MLLDASAWISLRESMAVLTLLLSLISVVGAQRYTFAVVPKDPAAALFFNEVNLGCQDRAAKRNVTCRFVYPDTASEQDTLVERLLNDSSIDGLAVSVAKDSMLMDVLASGNVRSIPIVTFDSDVPEGSQNLRLYYIGTDNVHLGKDLGQALLNVSTCTEDCSYGLLTDVSPNHMLRAQGVQQALNDSSWNLVGTKFSNDSTTIAIHALNEFMETYPDLDAIISTGGSPMWSQDPTSYKEFVDAYPALSLVVGDSLPIQIDLLDDGYVDALVGQEPYQMGELSVDVLLAILDNGTYNDFMGDTIYTGTKTYLREKSNDERSSGAFFPLFQPALAVVVIFMLSFVSLT